VFQALHPLEVRFRLNHADAVIEASILRAVDFRHLRSTQGHGGDANASTFTTINRLGREPNMRYMMIVRGSEDFAASGPRPASLIEAIEKLGEEALEKGKMVSFGGLHHTSSGARVRSSKGKIVTTDGPFTESKEVIGGFSIFNFSSKEEALEEARNFMELHRIHWPTWEGEIEIRLMYEENDQL
jgi:hypothetical protein